MARATARQFEDAHLDPDDCDDCVEYNGIWFSCPYHAGYLNGYVEGFEDGREENHQNTGPPTRILVTPGTPEPNT